MNENRNPLNIFGQFLMENLRDPSINYYDKLARGYWKGRGAAQLQTDLQSLSEQQLSIVRRCVITAVDVGIHDFLFKLQELADFENNIQIYVDGVNVVELSDGLHGELFSENGWRAKYSKFGESSEIG